MLVRACGAYPSNRQARPAGLLLLMGVSFTRFGIADNGIGQENKFVFLRLCWCYHQQTFRFC
jgi:hypothetical protein